MAPLGTDPQAAQPMTSGAPQAMMQGPHSAQVPYSGMHQHQQQLSPPSMNPAMPNTSMEGPPGAPTGDVIQVEKSVLIKKKTKKQFYLILRLLI